MTGSRASARSVGEGHSDWWCFTPAKAHDVERAEIEEMLNIKRTERLCDPSVSNKHSEDMKQAVADGLVLKWSHGESGYQNHGCRCDVCSEAHRAAQQRYASKRTLK